MTITVDIEPEVQAELKRRADAHGSQLETYVARLLEDAVHLPAHTLPLSEARILTTLREMA